MRLEELLTSKVKEQLDVKETHEFSQKENEPLTRIALPEEKKIEEELKKQAIVHQGSVAGLDDWLEDDSQPVYREEEKKVKVTYKRTGGYVGYVDLNFSVLDETLSTAEYDRISQQLTVISKAETKEDVEQAIRIIEGIGEKAWGVVFRKIYLFNFKNKETRYKIEMLIQLCSRLMVLSLTGRLTLKAILQHTTNEQYSEFAMLIAGQINEREVIPEILQNAKMPNLIVPAIEALLLMRSTDAVRQLIPLIDQLDGSRKDLIGEAIKLARHFNLVDSSIVKELFYTYLDTPTRSLRPIYSVGIKSFGVDIIPPLYAVIENETDLYKVREAAKLIGGTRQPLASTKLKEAYEKFPSKRIGVMEGLGHTKDRTIAPFVAEELKKATQPRLQEASIVTLASLDDDTYIPVLRSYTSQKEVGLAAVYALTRLGDKEALKTFIDLLTSGSAEEQQRLRSYTTLLHFKAYNKIAEKLLLLPDNQKIQLLMALQRPNLLPKEVGTVLKELLQRQPSAPVRLEIYRLAAKFIGTKTPMLPEKVIYEAGKKETDPLMKRELQKVYKGKGTEGGIGKHG